MVRASLAPYPLVYGTRTNLRSSCPWQIGLRCHIRITCSNRVFPQKIGCRTCQSYICVKCFKKQMCLVMSRKCLWSIWDYPGPIAAFSAPTPPKHNCNKSFQKTIKVRQCLYGIWRGGCDLDALEISYIFVAVVLVTRPFVVYLCEQRTQ